MNAPESQLTKPDPAGCDRPRTRRCRTAADTEETSEPALSSPEVTALLEELRRARHYLEYGAGLSTLLASTCPNIVTIDSVHTSDAHLGQVGYQARRRSGHDSAGLFRPLRVQLGPAAPLVTSPDAQPQSRWISYATAPFQAPRPYDFVFVDGRFRVACAATCALYLPPGTRVAVHDFATRPHYRPLLDLMTFIRQVETLAFFVVGPTPSAQDRLAILARAALDPRE